MFEQDDTVVRAENAFLKRRLDAETAPTRAHLGRVSLIQPNLSPYTRGNAANILDARVTVGPGPVIELAKKFCSSELALQLETYILDRAKDETSLDALKTEAITFLYREITDEDVLFEIQYSLRGSTYMS